MTEVALTNTIEVVGTLITQRAGKKDLVVKTNYQRGLGRFQNLKLQVIEEDGTTYELPISIPAALNVVLAEEDTPTPLNAKTLVLQEGMRLRATGRLAQRLTYDRRFISREFPQGRPTSELVVDVETLTLASEEDIDGTLATLIGVIADPPRLVWHEKEKAQRVARGRLRVEMLRLSARASQQRLVYAHTDHVPLDIPLNLPDADVTYRAGNKVRVMGHLEGFLKEIRPPRERSTRPGKQNAVSLVQEREAQLWAEQLEQATGAKAKAALETEMMRSEDRRRWEQGLRLRGMFVELLDGERLSEAEANTARKAWQTAQDARYGQQRQDRAPSRPPQQEQEQEAPQLAVEFGDASSESPSLRGLSSRRPRGMAGRRKEGQS